MTREELRDYVEEQRSLNMIPYHVYSTIVDGIDELEQEPKTGHWIEHPEIETSTPEYLMFYECSECGNKQCFYMADTHRRNYCGECGCHMVEPQERSE